MKTANMGYNSKVTGSLRKTVAFALVAVAGLSGVAGAQVVLGNTSIAVDADPIAENPFNLTITINRTDATADPDSDVTAVGGELTLPAGYKLALDADNSCDAVLQDGETSLDNQTQGVNARVEFKRSATTFLDPPDNTECTPVPETGDVLEFFWLETGSNDPLPVSFPIVLNLVIEANNPGDTATFDLTTKYRVGDGAEQTTDAPQLTVGVDLEGGCSTPGDADGSGGVDPADAQLAFEAFLQIPAALDAIDPACGDFCNTGNGVDPADAQGIFNAFLQVANPCG